MLQALMKRITAIYLPVIGGRGNKRIFDGSIHTSPHFWEQRLHSRYDNRKNALMQQLCFRRGRDMKNPGYNAMLSGSVLLITACSASPPISSGEPGPISTSLEAPDQAPSLYGRWRITELNGTPPKSMNIDVGGQPTLVFTPGHYGGSTGCNGFGGIGLLFGDRWFGEPPMQTEMGCGDLSAQESAIIGIAAGGPKVTFGGNDSATLTTATGILRLQRDKTPVTETPTEPPMLLAGTSWSVAPMGGGWPQLDRGERQPQLTFEADDWILVSPCASRTGKWQQGDASIILQSGNETARPCRSELAEPDAALGRALTGKLHYVIGPNDEIVLANASQWMAGQHDRTFGNDDKLLTAGAWQITEVDGAILPASARPPTLNFGAGSFAVWDGCRHSEGVALTYARQLFTLGSGVVTMANCPPDPVRKRINDVVSASPKIARAGERGVALISRVGTLRLVQTSAKSFGTGVVMQLRSGMKFDLTARSTENGKGTEPEQARLVLGPGDKYQVTLACGSLQGRWRNNRRPGGWYTRFGPDGVQEPCASNPNARAMENFFMGDVLVAVGANGDIALFLNERGSLAARIAD